MKKYSGTVVYIGIMVGLFGLLILGAANAATGFVLGGSYPAAGVFVTEMAKTASDVSLGLLVIGTIFLLLGLYMRTGID